MLHDQEAAYASRWAALQSIAQKIGFTPETLRNETINGLYKTQVIREPGPWPNVDRVEYATLEWVD